MTVETPVFPNPNYTLDGKLKPQPPAPESSIVTKRGDGSPAWFTWFAIRHGDAYDMAKDRWIGQDGTKFQSMEWQRESALRLDRIERKPDGLRVHFNYDKTGTNPAWAWVFCTWDEIEAHSGGTRE